MSNGMTTDVKEALQTYDAIAHNIGSCGDAHCVVLHRSGMVTNGGCRCSHDRLTAQRMMSAGDRLAKAVRAALSSPGDAVREALVKCQKALSVMVAPHNHLISPLSVYPMAVEAETAARAALSSRPAAIGRETLPEDVIELVIAARIVAFEDQSPEALKCLDQASEAFADRVPWDDEHIEAAKRK